MTLGSNQLGEWKKGWPVVLVTSVGTLMLGLKTTTLGPLIPFIEAETGWGRAEISTGLSISFLMAFVLMPLFGTLADRIGVRLVALPGIVLFGISLLILAGSGPGISSWFLGWVILSLGYSAAMPVWLIAVAGHFNAARGMAIAVTTSGIGVATIAGPLLSAVMAEEFGWRTAYAVLAAIPLLVVLPLALIFFFDARFAGRSARSLIADFTESLNQGPSRRSAAAAAAAPAAPPSEDREPTATDHDAPAGVDGLTIGEIVRTRQFWLMAFASLCLGGAFPGFSLHIVPMLIEIGQTPTGAAAIVSAVGFGTVTGRLLGGLLLDRVHGGLLAALFMVIAVLGLWPVIAQAESQLVLTTSLFIFGLAVGVEADCVPYVTSKYFGVKRFGFASSTLTGIMALGASVGPIVGGRIYDVFDNYLYFQIYIVCAIGIAAACFLGLGRYPGDLEAHPSPA